jgi:lipoprotein-releasing system permease protein
MFINIIAIISMLGVAVGVAAIIIILSVFNGLESLIRKQYNLFNPELKISPAQGKTFVYDAALAADLEQVPGVALISEVIEDDAVLRYKEAQMVGKIKGVSDNFLQQSRLPATLLGGRFVLEEDSLPRAVIGYGVADVLSVNLADFYASLEIWYPQRRQKITMSEKDIRRENLQVSGVFSVEYEHDQKMVIVPLSFAQKLMDYGPERSFLEVKAQSGYALSKLQKALQSRLGERFRVENQEEQQASVLRAIKIEKLFAYLTLSFVLAIASLNTFFALSMLAIEKQKDIAMLKAMGAANTFVYWIFLKEGAWVTFVGAALGLLAGCGIVLLQDYFGLVSMGMQTSVIDAYPVELRLFDVAIVVAVVVLISLAISHLPARRAAQTEVKAQL